MKTAFVLATLLLLGKECFCWGFYAHQKINYFAVFLLPPEMVSFYKPAIAYLSEHAVDPDKRRYAVADEAPRHFIDIDRYGKYPFPELPRRWDEAIARYGEDSLRAHGIVPWWIEVMTARLTKAFREKNAAQILKLSAELGHYVSDAHVPLHACHNYNGQLTGQKGIHGFWESRVPELLAEIEWDFFIGRAGYLPRIPQFIWNRVLESSAAADSVLLFERELALSFPADKKFAFESRNGKIVRQYSAAYTKAYDSKLNGMVERRMRQSIYAVASLWYTAWVNAGQPDLRSISINAATSADEKEWDTLNAAWNNSGSAATDCYD